RAQQFGPHEVVVRDSKNIVFENIVVRDPAAWCLHMLNSEHVVLRNLKGIDNRDVLNADGFDITSCRHAVVEDCFHYCSDDAAVVKSCEGRPVTDVLVKGNILMTKKSALKIGTETEADISDVTFIDNDVVESDRGMTLSCED